jgi:acetyl esterase/lipase
MLRTLFLTFVAVSITTSASRAFASDNPELPARFEVKQVSNIVYRPWAANEDASLNKNKLDLYLPVGCRDFPVMMFIHGGAWVFGDKNQLGLYQMLANYWAKRGIGVVVANYRLSPGVQHPAHIQDVAKAFAWINANIGGYGGDVHQLFVSGQSAGGHLVSLLATDESYLKAEGLALSDIKGVLTLSGVYNLPARYAASGLPAVAGMPTGRDAVQPRSMPFARVFGNDPKLVQQAAPMSHVHKGLPPFMVLFAQRDPKILREMAVEFSGALKKAGQSVDLVEAPGRNHFTEILFMGQKGDPVVAAMTGFLRTHAKIPTAQP